MIRRFVRAHPFLTFYALSVLIAGAVVVWRLWYGQAWSERTGEPFDYYKVLWEGLKVFSGNDRLYPNVISIGWVAIMREPIYFGVFLFAGAPTIAAILTAGLAGGWEGIKRLFARLKPWSARAYRRDALVTYAWLAGLIFVACLAHLAVIAFAKGSGQAAEQASFWGLSALLFPIPFLIGGLIDEGGTCEELGWRGLALPLLLERIGCPLVASVVLGVLWWAWHFPRELPDMIAGKTDWAAFAPAQGVFILLVVALSVLATFMFHRTGGSALPGLLLHGWTNFLSKGLSIYGIVNIDTRTWLCIAAAVVLLLIVGPQLGRQRYLQLSPTGKGEASFP